MPTACQCGMDRDSRPGLAGCRECGTTTCPSCAITVGALALCRWCAPAAARVA